MTTTSKASDEAPAGKIAEYTQAVLSLAQPGASDYPELPGDPFVVLDLASGQSTAGQISNTEQILQIQLPVIGIASHCGDAALAKACDVLVLDRAEASLLITNIGRSPRAATVLVQLLRATESLAVDDALNMESLAYSTLQSGPEFARWLRSERPKARHERRQAPPLVLNRLDGTLHIELNRAENRNAMSIEMRDALIEALELVLADASITNVQISARGKCFSTGGDLAEFGTAPDPATAHLVRGLRLPGRLLARCAERVQVRVHGACIGSGIEFSAFAAALIAAPNTYFQLPELRLGLIPGAGGTVSVVRRIGRQRAAWLLLSGRRLPARQALDWGLIDQIQAPY